MRWPWQRQGLGAAGPWTAVALNASGMHVAQADLRGARLRVTLCESFDLQRGTAQALRDLRARAEVRGSRVVVLLEPGHYQMNLVDAPAVPREELAAALRWSLKDLLDYPAEQATLDYLDMPGGTSSAGGSGSLLVISAPNARVEACQSLFREAQLPLAAIEVAETGQRNLAGLFEEAGHALALLLFHPRGSTLTLTARGELYLVRGSEVGLDRLEAASGEEREALLERFIVELQRSLDHFERKHGGLPVGRLLLPPTHGELNLQQRLADSLYVPVQTLELSSVADLEATRQRGAALAPYLHLVGACLREREALQ